MPDGPPSKIDAHSDCESYPLDPGQPPNSLVEARRRELSPSAQHSTPVESRPASEFAVPQITMRQVLLLLVASSIIFALGARIDRSLFALGIGLASLATLFGICWLREPPGWLTVGWWMLLGIYVLASVTVVLGSP